MKIEEKALAWVRNKANKDWVVEQVLQDNQPIKKKIAFFMAGVPGAGKTEFASRLITRGSIHQMLRPTIIEHDGLVEYIPGYKTKSYYHYRRAGNWLVGYLFNFCLKNSYSFIFDGTLSHPTSSKNVQRALDKDYGVFVIYVMQTAEQAWEVTGKRRQISGRPIEKEGFKDTCQKINPNLRKLLKDHMDNPNFLFTLIDKAGNLNLQDGFHLETVGLALKSKKQQFGKILEYLQKEYNTDNI